MALEALAAGDFYHPADPVQTAAIGPPGTRLEHQRHARQSRVAAGNLEIANDIRIPKQIAEPGRVRQQVAKRYGFLRRAQLRNAFCIETSENLGRPERRIYIAGR